MAGHDLDRWALRRTKQPLDPAERPLLRITGVSDLQQRALRRTIGRTGG